MGDAALVLPYVWQPIKWGKGNLYTMVHKKIHLCRRLRADRSQPGVHLPISQDNDRAVTCQSRAMAGIEEIEACAIFRVATIQGARTAR